MKSLDKTFSKSRVCVVVTFMLAATCAWAASDRIINNFTGNNGSQPVGPVTLGRAGGIYGTTYSGGTYGFGNVYQLTQKGGVWKETVIYSFTGGADGGSPMSGLILDKSGELYGTTASGGDSGCTYNGQSGCGVVFRLTRSGGSWIETILHSFSGGADGAGLNAGVTMDAQGRLYGATVIGGTGSCASGCGLVFRLHAVGGSWKKTVLYNFHNDGKDGTYPVASLILDREGNLYGTTDNGGDFQGCQPGCGAVFELTPPSNGKGSWKERILYSFPGGDGGCYPDFPVIQDKSGNIFGATYSCGTSGNAGTVFELKHSGKGFVHHVILNLDNSLGEFPNGLAIDSDGNLFGTTNLGGTYGCGAVFELRHGTWTYLDIHAFRKDSSDGCYSNSGPTLDSSGSVYGSTLGGGSSGDGVVYRVAR